MIATLKMLTFTPLVADTELALESRRGMGWTAETAVPAPWSSDLFFIWSYFQNRQPMMKSRPTAAAARPKHQPSVASRSFQRSSSSWRPPITTRVIRPKVAVDWGGRRGGGGRKKSMLKNCECEFLSWKVKEVNHPSDLKKIYFFK